jgi:hypothetical protein
MKIRISIERIPYLWVIRLLPARGNIVGRGCQVQIVLAVVPVAFLVVVIVLGLATIANARDHPELAALLALVTLALAATGWTTIRWLVLGRI